MFCCVFSTSIFLSANTWYFQLSTLLFIFYWFRPVRHRSVLSVSFSFPTHLDRSEFSWYLIFSCLVRTSTLSLAETSINWSGIFWKDSLRDIFSNCCWYVRAYSSSAFDLNPSGTVSFKWLLCLMWKVHCICFSLVDRKFSAHANSLHS